MATVVATVAVRKVRVEFKMPLYQLHMAKFATRNQAITRERMKHLTHHILSCERPYLLYMLFNTVVFSFFGHIFEIAEDL
jgi:hypothetical protein